MRRGIVCTGQESVVSTKPCLVHIYKKVVSADPVPSRVPYGRITRLVRVRGLQRFEMNEVMKLSGVAPRALNSVIRRTSCVEFIATFHQRMQWLAPVAKEMAALGISERDAGESLASKGHF